MSETQTGGCLPAVATHTLTGSNFSLEIASVDEICPHPSGMSAGSKIVGNWTVTGGSGTYAGASGSGTSAGASGSGTSAGVIGGQGNVPLTLLGQITR